MAHLNSLLRSCLLTVSRIGLTALSLAPVCVGAAPASGKLKVPAVVRLDITPAVVHLVGPEKTQRLLATATLADGTQCDVTDKAVFAASDPKRFAVTKDGEVAARQDGAGVVTARWGGKVAGTKVQAQGTRGPLAVSFVDDVVPILSRLGCSAGACHGAQQGKGGFRLSLRGYAPEIDYISITRQLGGRRISRENPAHSLFLRKPLADVPHRGGKRLDAGSREYRTLLTWLQQGANGPTGKEAPLAQLEILPGDRQLKPGQTQRLLTRATFADGRVEDVTDHALYAANDVAIATVTADGQVTMQRSGETAVTAKYMDKLATVRFVAPYAQKVSDAAYRARNNYIDDLVNAKLKQLHIEPSGLCTDQEFLRRAYIDAIGTLPTADEAHAFLADPDPNKRDRLVDALLQRPEYGMVWALKFGDLFVLRREYMHRKYAMLLQQWLMEQFNADRPWDKIVTDLLTASGDLDQNRAGYFFVSRTPQKEGEGYWVRAPQVTAEMTAQVFLGSRIQCAKCHNHPTERYTQDDYYHYAALWQQVTGKGDNDDGVPQTLAATAGGDVRQPRTGELMSPRPLDRSDLHYAKDEDRRIKAAAWLVSRDEFARAIVNRYWARCFGSGIVEPVDDIRSTNPAKNEPLMRALCDDLRRHNYDLKYLLGAILKSRTYQLSSLTNRTNKIDTRLYSHYMPRRLPAEELADAVAQTTGVPDRYAGLAPGTRACELADTEIPSIMLDTFGRPPRVQPSDGERNCNPAISQALALLNGAEIQQKLKSEECVINTLLKSGKPDAELLDTLFLSTLARYPTPAEAKALLAMIAQAPKHEEGFQDALWALLNSKEFLFNH
jgi:hypothetical protein